MLATQVLTIIENLATPNPQAPETILKIRLGIRDCRGRVVGWHPGSICLGRPMVYYK